MQSTLIPTSNRRMPYFKALDGVRAWCVLLVMFDHLKAGSHTLSWLNGHLGVDIFFIISGFLITTLLLREKFFTGTVNFKGFYIRRFFRLVPVYAVVLLLYVVILQAPAQSLRWHQFKAGLPYFLTFMNEFAIEPSQGSVFMHTWSLGVEEKFYLLWPFLIVVVARTAPARALLCGLLLAILAIAPLLGHGYLARAYFGLLTGCIMAWTLASSYAPSIFAALRRLPSVAFLALFALGFYAEHVSKNLMAIFSLTAAVFLAFLIASPTSWLSNLHQWPPLAWLGRRSYAMYLVHILCLNALEARVHIDTGWKAVAVLAAAYALSALAAELLYRTIEQPARQWGLRLSLAT